MFSFGCSVGSIQIVLYVHVLCAPINITTINNESGQSSAVEKLNVGHDVQVTGHTVHEKLLRMSCVSADGLRGLHLYTTAVMPCFLSVMTEQCRRTHTYPPGQHRYLQITHVFKQPKHLLESIHHILLSLPGISSYELQ